MSLLEEAIWFVFNELVEATYLYEERIDLVYSLARNLNENDLIRMAALTAAIESANQALELRTDLQAALVRITEPRNPDAKA
jgi:hypothetical protein